MARRRRRDQCRDVGDGRGVPGGHRRALPAGVGALRRHRRRAAAGRRPGAWWPPEHRETTLHRILVHLIAETERHAGHADLVRELIDGSAGCGPTTTTCRRATRTGGRATGTELERAWPSRGAERGRLHRPSRRGRVPVPARRGGRDARPWGSSSPSSSKRTTPLHSRRQPCSGWLLTTAARSRASLVASGQGVTWWHIRSHPFGLPARCRELLTVFVRLPGSASVRPH